jgi:hypothetical protein
MTLTVAALVLTNLVYLAGAVAVASLVSGLYVLRHRKPKSLESGIESFSRELRALAPERKGAAEGSEEATSSVQSHRSDLRGGPTARRNGPPRPAAGAVATATGQRAEAAVAPTTPDPDVPLVADVPPVADATPTDDGDGTDPRSRSG